LQWNQKRNVLSASRAAKIWIADDFDAPLPDDLLAAFYGGEIPKLESKPNKDQWTET
jgi:hypothetical protein